MHLPSLNYLGIPNNLFVKKGAVIKMALFEIHATCEIGPWKNN